MAQKKSETLESFLNGGLYRNTCQKLNIFVKNVKQNFLHGYAKRKNSVQTSVDISGYIGRQQKNVRQEKTLIANFVKKNFMYQVGEQKIIGENIAHKNVTGKINQSNVLGKEIHNTSMEESKRLGTFMFQLSGEKCENGFMKEIILSANSAENMAESYMPTMLYQLENVKTHSENQILSRCVDSATNNIIVLNNRTGGEHEFYK